MTPMPDYAPLTEEERAEEVERATRGVVDDDWLLRAEIANITLESLRAFGRRMLRYEATVAALEARLAEVEANYKVMLDAAADEMKRRQGVEAENARLRPLAATGEAVCAMPIGGLLARMADSGTGVKWQAFVTANPEQFYDEVYGILAVICGCHKTVPEAVAVMVTDDAALRAAKGEG